MLSKRLICLSLIVTTLFISHRASGMGAEIVGPITVVVVVKVTPVGIAVAGAGIAAVGTGVYATYRGVKWAGNKAWSGISNAYTWWNSPSKATLRLKQEMEQKFVELEKKVADSEKARAKESEAGKQVLTLVQSLLDQVSADRKKADEKSNEWKTLRILKNAIPAGLRQKIKLASDASVDAIKMGGIAAWKFTCKDHPYTTITCVLLPAGYVFYRKYGKNIREACTRQFTSEEQALMKTHAIDIEPKK